MQNFAPSSAIELVNYAYRVNYTQPTRKVT